MAQSRFPYGLPAQKLAKRDIVIHDMDFTSKDQMQRIYRPLSKMCVIATDLYMENNEDEPDLKKIRYHSIIYCLPNSIVVTFFNDRSKHYRTKVFDKTNSESMNSFWEMSYNYQHIQPWDSWEHWATPDMLKWYRYTTRPGIKSIRQG